MRAPRDADTNNEYKVTVEADDGTYMDTLEVTVTVTDVDEVPTMISAGPSNTDYAENDTRVVATYTVTGTNAALVTWDLEGTDSDVFDISSNGGVLTFRSPPDYEMPADADNNNIYMVTVKASAGTDMDSLDVTVTVTDVDETPSISGPSNTDVRREPHGRRGDLHCDGSRRSNNLLARGHRRGCDFDISNGGVLTFKSSPDYEMAADADNNNIYMITVNASAGADMDSLPVTVTVTDVDEALTSISGPSNTDYAENGTDDVATFAAMDPDGTAISWTLEGTDAGVFDISSGGVLTFRAPPTTRRQTPTTDNVYMITVKASDGGYGQPSRDRHGHGRQRSADVDIGAE